MAPANSWRYTYTRRCRSRAKARRSRSPSDPEPCGYGGRDRDGRNDAIATAGVSAGAGDIIVSPTLTIPRAELQSRASRAGGPGGQHVNTSSTRIELLWDLTHSTVVTDEVRARLLAKLAGRLDAAGMVRVVASDRRSQAQNRQAAVPARSRRKM